MPAPFFTFIVTRSSASWTGGSGNIQVSVTSRIVVVGSRHWCLPYRFPETDKISPPLLQMNEVTFGYSIEKLILQRVNFDIDFDSRIAIVGANGAGKSTLFVDISRGLSKSKTEVGSKSWPVNWHHCQVMSLEMVDYACKIICFIDWWSVRK